MSRNINPSGTFINLSSCNIDKQISTCTLRHISTLFASRCELGMGWTLSLCYVSYAMSPFHHRLVAERQKKKLEPMFSADKKIEIEMKIATYTLCPVAAALISANLMSDCAPRCRRPIAPISIGMLLATPRPVLFIPQPSFTLWRWKWSLAHSTFCTHACVLLMIASICSAR